MLIGRAQISAVRRIGFRASERPSTLRFALGRRDIEITPPFAGVLSGAGIEGGTAGGSALAGVDPPASDIAHDRLGFDRIHRLVEAIKHTRRSGQIGRASCRERVYSSV